MRTLILVRHSESKLDPEVPPQQWILTKEGKQRCVPLSTKLADYNPKGIVTSEEVKARETGEIVAKILGLPCITAQDIHEHRRKAGGNLSPEAWQIMVASLFKSPSECIFGLETANQALERFSRAIYSIMEKQQGRSLAVVTHGTVMSLYYRALTGEDAYQFWCHLGLPAFYTVSWPDREVLSIETAITD